MAIAFRVPTFNLSCRIWSADDVTQFPPLMLPRLTQRCGLRLVKVAFMAVAPGTFATGVMALELPAKTDIRSPSFSTPSGDVVECPAASGRFYRCTAADDVARGFDNEYRLAAISPIRDAPGAWPPALT